jgi:hypothetical protein
VQRARRGSERLVEIVVPLTREARRTVREAVIGEFKRVCGWEPPAKRPPAAPFEDGKVDVAERDGEA